MLADKTSASPVTTVLAAIDLSSFDISNVTNMSYMFADSYVTTIYARTAAKHKGIAL